MKSLFKPILLLFYLLSEKLKGYRHYDKVVNSKESLTVKFNTSQNIQILIEVHVHEYEIRYERIKFFNRRVVTYQISGTLPMSVNPMIRDLYAEHLDMPQMLPWFVSEEQQKQAIVHAFLDVKKKQVENLKEGKKNVYES